MKPTVVELFCGAGGLSLGLRRAGAHVVYAADASTDAISTYRLNHRDVTAVVEELTPNWHVNHPELLDIDILAGGPPCKGWSTLGRRSQDERRERNNSAIGIFAAQVEHLRPKAFVMENVRGLAVHAGGATLDRLITRMSDAGYVVQARLLRASDYGVPQQRHRLFVVGVRDDLPIEYVFPRKGPRRSRSVADAISDLPELTAGEAADGYSSVPATPLQRRLRGGTSRLTWHHAPDHAAGILRLLSFVPHDGGDLKDVPEEQRPKSGFHNTYARLSWNKPAPAVTSTIGRVSSGRHAHPFQDRALTPREAARLQTFPDSYRWSGRGTYSVYELIGNAVPPLLAEAVCRPLVRALEAATLQQAR